MAYDEELADRLREILAAESGVTEIRMFGGLAFLLSGNMAVCVRGQGGLMVRVDPAQSPALVARPHAERIVMRGRAMDGWLLVDPAGVDDDAELRRWTDVGLAWARSLPPKRATRAAAPH